MPVLTTLFEILLKRVRFFRKNASKLLLILVHLHQGTFAQWGRSIFLPGSWKMITFACNYNR